jgi:uncharacterized membrane protein YphA (DoxX/SURF4 family)
MKKFLSSKFFRFLSSGSVAALLFFICPPCFNKTAIGIILAILMLLVNAPRLINRLPFLIHVSRILVGGLFIFSGFIKANDPLGFSYKLEEYFEVFKNDTGFGFFGAFAHIALPLAIILCASEIIFGVLLLIGYKRNLTLGLLSAQIMFFTFLTFYSACYNKVTTCGCFGDFLVLKPWTSFWKDVVLLILITLLISGKEQIKQVFNPMICSTLFLMAIIVSIGFPIYAYRNLPPLDFRAYKIGNNIRVEMKTKPTYKPAEYETGFIYENIKTGKKEHFNLKNYPWDDTLNWRWMATDNIIIKEAIDAPKITDFTVSGLDGEALTDALLNDKNYSFWLVMYDINKADDGATLMAKINDLYKLASIEKLNVHGLTASSAKDIDAFKHEHNLLVDFNVVDGIVLKTMIRSNPGLMLMKNGTVIMNWHHNDFPTFSDVKGKWMKE